MTARPCYNSLKVDLLYGFMCCLHDETDQEWKHWASCDMLKLTDVVQSLWEQTNCTLVAVRNNIQHVQLSYSKAGLILIELSKLSSTHMLDNTLKAQCFLKTPSKILS